MHGRDASLRVALSFKTDEADTVGSGEPNRSARGRRAGAAPDVRSGGHPPRAAMQPPGGDLSSGAARSDEA
jgi:hypothetical protein